MASAEGSERCATLNWEIENFDLLETALAKKEEFYSPVWKVELNGGNIWCELCVSHRDNFIALYIVQLQEVSVKVRCDLSIISSCGEVPLKKTLIDDFFYAEKVTVFGDKKQSKLLNNALILRWKIRCETIKNQELRITSVLHSIKHIWNLQHFDSSCYYRSVVEQDNFLLFFSLKAKSKVGNSMVVEMSSSAEICASFVDCTLSTTNGCELIKNEGYYFYNIKWTCDIERLPEKTEMIDLQFRSIVSLHKNCQTVKHENASDALSGPSTRSDDFLILYREGTLSDATLNTKGKSFSAHRSILAARSPFFHAMFEKDEGRSGIVDIDDVDSETVERMLVFLYSEKLDNVQWEEASALYYAADKYDVPSLKCRCVDILKAGLAVNNACDVLVLAYKHSDEKLRKCVVDFISDHHLEVFASSKWKKLEESNPRLTIKIIHEVCVIKAVADLGLTTP